MFEDGCVYMYPTGLHQGRSFKWCGNCAVAKSTSHCLSAIQYQTLVELLKTSIMYVFKLEWLINKPFLMTPSWQSVIWRTRKRNWQSIRVMMIIIIGVPSLRRGWRPWCAIRFCQKPSHCTVPYSFSSSRSRCQSNSFFFVLCLFFHPPYPPTLINVGNDAFLHVQCDENTEIPIQIQASWPSSNSTHAMHPFPLKLKTGMCAIPALHVSHRSCGSATRAKAGGLRNTNLLTSIRGLNWSIISAMSPVRLEQNIPIM